MPLSILLATVAALGNEARPAPPQKLLTTTIGGRDLRFLTDALEFGLEQVFLTDLARKQAQGERVKAIAGVLAETQQEENAKIERLAATKSVPLSAKEAGAEKSLVRKFAKLKGEKFDQAWIEQIVTLNQKSVANYNLASQSTDADIKAFAIKALPLAKEKLSLVTRETSSSTPPRDLPNFRTNTSQPAPRQ
jgi:putative membrane protein